MKKIKKSLAAALASNDEKTLRAVRDRIASECTAEIKAVLEKHHCKLAATPALTRDGRIVVGNIFIVPEES